MDPSTTSYPDPALGSEAVSPSGTAVSRPWPLLTDRLVKPETPYEMLDGKLVMPPYDPAHGECRAVVARALSTHVAPGFIAAIDLLTRVDKQSDIAPDVSVRRAGQDPATGTRYLEELVFEIKYTPRQEQLSRRAMLFAQRGVRRIFAVWCKSKEGKVLVGPVCEWQPEQAEWHELADSEVIEDPCLTPPLPVRTLLDIAAADEARAHVFVRAEHRVIRDYGDANYQQGESHGHKNSHPSDRCQTAELQGYKKGLRQAVAEICKVFDIALSDERDAALHKMEAGELLRLQSELLRHRRWPGR